jgi:phosphatidylglycerol:prolipoprotein diacylglycerol transferase
MYPTLPFGPLSLPTGPVLAIFAVIVTLEVGGRYGRRLQLHPDDVWNTGLIGLAVGLIVARLWNVFQFWYIYQAEPQLIFSLRPSGFAFWPGLVAAATGGYAYLWRRRLDPVKVAAALVVGMTGGGVIQGIAGYATGAVLGAVSDVPWALNYFGELRHPAGLYRGLGFALLCGLLWLRGDHARPGRLVWQAVLGYALIRLVADAYLDGGSFIAGVRVSQAAALITALVAARMLARRPGSAAPSPVAPQTQ